MKSLQIIVLVAWVMLAIMIAPLRADTALPATAPAGVSASTLAPRQIRITKYPGDNCSFKIETSKGLVIITDPCDMNEEVHPDMVFVSHSHDDHADFSIFLYNATKVNPQCRFKKDIRFLVAMLLEMTGEGRY
ncbi:MAG: hypothetical protein EHM45_04665 [Desulfobacteraceae bacterium]|nr:MAG: hypothetical protein EHM45_04665 [Desulfobacteraceae bacterium]